MRSRIWLVAVMMLVALSACAEKPQESACPVTFSVTSTITTNEVNESDYKTQEPGYEWTEDHTPRNYTWENAVLSLCATNSFIVYGYNQNKVNGPDPFEEKVTVNRYVVVSNALYTMHVGPFESNQATRHTVLRRWQIVHKQKLNMSESTETIEN